METEHFYLGLAEWPHSVGAMICSGCASQMACPCLRSECTGLLHFDHVWDRPKGDPARELRPISKCDKCGCGAADVVGIERIDEAMKRIRTAVGLPWIAQVSSANEGQRRAIGLALKMLSETARSGGDILSLTYSAVQ